MNIVVINAFSALAGGGVTYLKNTLKYVPSDLNILILVSPKNYDIFLPNANDRIKLVNIEIVAKSIFHRIWWEKTKLAGFLKKHKADIYFAPGGIVNIAMHEGCKSYTTFQNMLPFAEIERKRYPMGYTRFRLWLLKRVFLNSFKKADKVIFISEYARNVIKTYIPDIEVKSSVIPHGIDEMFFQEPNAEVIEKSDFYLYVSIVDVYKAQLELVHAWKNLVDKGFVKKLYFVGGEYKPYANKVRRLISDYGLGDVVILIGKIPYDELNKLYGKARGLVFASSCENCPNILLESMASGKMIFCSDYQPMPEFAGDSVIYFDPYDPQELADKILKAEKEADYAEYGRKAFDMAKKYEIKDAVEKTYGFLNGLYS